jgi:hypothetical protein
MESGLTHLAVELGKTFRTHLGLASVEVETRISVDEGNGYSGSSVGSKGKKITNKQITIT